MSSMTTSQPTLIASSSACGGGARLADDLQVVGAVDQLLESGTNERVIVDDQNTFLRAVIDAVHDGCGPMGSRSGVGG